MEEEGHQCDVIVGRPISAGDVTRSRYLQTKILRTVYNKTIPRCRAFFLPLKTKITTKQNIGDSREQEAIPYNKFNSKKNFTSL